MNEKRGLMFIEDLNRRQRFTEPHLQGLGMRSPAMASEGRPLKHEHALNLVMDVQLKAYGWNPDASDSVGYLLYFSPHAADQQHWRAPNHQTIRFVIGRFGTVAVWSVARHGRNNACATVNSGIALVDNSQVVGRT